MDDAKTLKFLTFNCNVLGSKVKAKRILSALLRSQADVIFLQETHKTTAQTDIFKCKKFSLQMQAPGTSKARGVAILISAALRPELLSSECDPTGRYLFLNVKLNNTLYTLASIYSPIDKQLEFLECALHKLTSFSQGPVILGGDLNVVEDPMLDYSDFRKRLCSPRSSWIGGNRLCTPFVQLWPLRSMALLIPSR